MFEGTYFHRLDEKHRLKLPGELAAPLGHHFTITRGLNRCLWLFTEPKWEEIRQKLLASDLCDPSMLHLRRFFGSGAHSITHDGQNRFVVPPPLRARAGIEQDVVVVGVFDHIEIWAADRWAEYEEQISEEAVHEWARLAGL